MFLMKPLLFASFGAVASAAILWAGVSWNVLGVGSVGSGLLALAAALVSGGNAGARLSENLGPFPRAMCIMGGSVVVLVLAFFAALTIYLMILAAH